jgi:hypothetical protein
MAAYRATICADKGEVIMTENEEKYHHRHSKKVIHNTVSWGFPSFIAYIGAAVYFVQQTNGAFWAVVLALLKAAVWPAFLVYHVLKLLGA